MLILLILLSGILKLFIMFENNLEVRFFSVCKNSQVYMMTAELLQPIQSENFKSKIIKNFQLFSGKKIYIE